MYKKPRTIIWDNAGQGNYEKEITFGFKRVHE